MTPLCLLRKCFFLEKRKKARFVSSFLNAFLLIEKILRSLKKNSFFIYTYIPYYTQLKFYSPNNLIKIGWKNSNHHSQE